MDDIPPRTIEKNTTEPRQGVTSEVVRRVHLIATVAAVLCMGLAYFAVDIV